MASDSKSKIDFDPYTFLAVDYDADEKAIVKAYRKQALKWHPDKNPNNKEYAESMFIKLSLALGVLTDAAAKGAVDRLRKAKAAVRERHGKMDAKRQKLKEELERREAGVADRRARDDEANAQRVLEKEIARLRKHHSTLIERERERIEREVHGGVSKSAERSRSPTQRAANTRLRVKWTPSTETQHDRTSLSRVFEKYGDVSVCVLSGKKPGSAVVEMVERDAAEHAVDVERGTDACPLKVTFASSAGDEEPTTLRPTTHAAPPPEDYESDVLQRMMQTQRRRNEENGKS